MPPKTIELPKARGDLYRFEGLPALIAEALHPEHVYPADCLLSCTIWRGVGDEGTYWRCIPPEGQCCPSIHEIGDVAEWSIEEIELTPEERLHPDRSNWHHFRWHVQRLPEDLQPRWPDGSLIVEQVRTGNDLARDVFMKSEHDWYRTRLCVAANADLGDPARLLVLDSLGNDIDFRHGAALDRGYVHLDELNRWGALQHPVRSFVALEEGQSAAADAKGSATQTHLTTTTRRNILTPIIEKAQTLCADPGDTAAVWGALSGLAEKQHSVLLGVAPEGVKYQEGGEVRFLSRDALSKRLRNAAKKNRTAQTP